MKFKLTCACWKVRITDESKVHWESQKIRIRKFGYIMVDHYNIPDGESDKELNKKVEINSIEDITKLADEYTDQWRAKYNPNEINSRDFIINFDKKKIKIYNSYVE